MSISDQIEQLTGVALPPEVKDYFENFPFGPQSYLVNEGYVYPSQRVLEDMRYSLAKGFFGQVWPAHHLILAGDNCGNELYEDLLSPELAIFMAEHEDANRDGSIEFKRWAESFSQWLKADLAHDSE